MPARVEDVRLDIYYPFTGGGGPDLQIPASDIREFETIQSYQGGRGGGTITIDNGDFGTDGEYNDIPSGTTKAREIDIGQKVEVRVLTEFEASSTSLDDAAARRWTALIADVDARAEPDVGNVLELSLEDFVFGILARRTVASAFRDTQVSGNSDDIVESILRRNASEIGRGRVSIVPENLTIGWNYDNLLEALRTVARRAGAVMASSDTDLDWDNIVNTRSDFTIADGDFNLPISNEISDEKLINQVYVTGGTGERKYVELTDTGTTQNVLGSNLISKDDYPVETATIPRVDLYTYSNNTDHNIRVRIQATDGNNEPVAPGNRTRDYGADTVDGDDIVNDGWTPFRVEADGINVSNIGIIINSTNENGSPYNEIAGNDTDNDGAVELPALRIYKPYPVVAQAADGTSQDAFRRQEARVKTRTQTKTAAEEVAQTTLDRRTPARETLSFRADSQDTHQATPKDVFELNAPAIRASGRYAIKRTRREYRANQLTTQIEAFNVASL